MQVLTLFSQPFVPEDYIFHFIEDLPILSLQSLVLLPQKIKIGFENLLQLLFLSYLLILRTSLCCSQKGKNTRKHLESTIPDQG